MKRRNRIVAGFGRKGTGKTQLLWDVFTSHCPRLLTFDSLNETGELDATAVYTVGLDATTRALRRAVNFDSWHIAAALDIEDVAFLFGKLAPPLGSSQSLSLALGGIAVQCGEVDTIAPNGSAPVEVVNALRRGRHYCLDFYIATQRPASCARDVSAQADEIFCFAQGEPRDVDFIARTISATVADRVQQLREYEYIHYDRRTGRAGWYGADRQLIEDVPL